MLAPYGSDEKSPAPDAVAPKESAEDPRLKRLEAQIDALSQQLEGVGYFQGYYFGRPSLERAWLRMARADRSDAPVTP